MTPYLNFFGALHTDEVESGAKHLARRGGKSDTVRPYVSVLTAEDLALVVEAVVCGGKVEDITGDEAGLVLGNTGTASTSRYFPSSSACSSA